MIVLAGISVSTCNSKLSKADPRLVTFKNNSDKNVIFYRSFTEYPNISDTNLAKPNNSLTLRSVSNNSQDDYALRGKWENFLSNFQDNIIIIFTLNYDSVIKYASPNPMYPWADTSQILKKQYVNIDTLVKYNWTITYP